MTNQPNLPDFEPNGQKPCSTEFAGKRNFDHVLILILSVALLIKGETQLWRAIRVRWLTRDVAKSFLFSFIGIVGIVFAFH
jgi:hypothetical protein